MKNLLSKEIQSNLLCSALEGGSNYWYKIVKSSESPEAEFYSDKPFCEGGYIIIADGEVEKKLTSVEFNKACELMHDKYTKHYADAVNGHDDATTGDIFLQLAVFGEVIYG